MPVLDTHWLRRAANRDPFTWLSTAPGEALSHETATRLRATFPEDGFRRKDATGQGREKSYRNYSRPLVVDSVPLATDLPPLWQRLVGELTADDYRKDVAALLGQEVARTVEIRLVRHAGGDWLSPHTDRADKLFSHIFYFNPGWRAEWGGCLEILSGNDPDAVVARIPPELGATALLARADNSWHQVSRVAAQPAPERTSLLVHGVR